VGLFIKIMNNNISPWVVVGLNMSKESRIKSFVTTICKHYKISESDLKLKSRKQSIVNAKKALAFYLHHNFRLTEQQIADEFKLGISRSCIHHHKVDFRRLLEVKDPDVVSLQSKLDNHLKKYDDILSFK
jgi:hypothetical protein